MTVYVDNARLPFGRMKMSHLWAFDKAELLRFAQEIGLKRRWMQGGARHIHFDVCESMRKKAVEAGAIEVTPVQLGRLVSGDGVNI